METEEISKLSGFTLLDTCILHGLPNFNLLEYLYDIIDISEASSEDLYSSINTIRRSQLLFSYPNVFSIKEVSDELNVGLKKLNEILKFHKDLDEGKYCFRSKSKFSRILLTFEPEFETIEDTKK